MTEHKSEDETETESASRRALLTGIAGLGAAGIFSAGRASAQSAPEGDIGTAENPYLRAYIDRQTYTGRTSDPTDPADGTTWYREDL